MAINNFIGTWQASYLQIDGTSLTVGDIMISPVTKQMVAVSIHGIEATLLGSEVATDVLRAHGQDEHGAFTFDGVLLNFSHPTQQTVLTGLISRTAPTSGGPADDPDDLETFTAIMDDGPDSEV